MASTRKKVAASAVELAADRDENRKAERLMASVAMAPRGNMAEVGCLRTVTEWRYDGWSTVYLARAAAKRGCAFSSFDTDADAVRIANQVLRQQGLKQLVKRADGAEALAGLGPLAFLYLDGSDDPRQTLEQYRAAELLPGAIVAVDDVQMIDWDKLHGKATALIPVLREEGHAFEIYTTEPGYSMLVARIKGDTDAD